MGVNPDLLLEVPMFQTLSLESRERLAGVMRDEAVPAGRVLFEVGDVGSSMYIVRSGKIKISMPGDSGEEVTLTTCGPGEFFGELALLDQNPRSARATAVEDTVIYSLEREGFLKFAGAVPDSLIHMLSATAKRLRHTDELMKSRASFDVNEEFERHETLAGRMADRLAAYAGSWGFILGASIFILSWIALNLYLAHLGEKMPFDSPELGFIKLALILGIMAAIQAPIIMMSQNRDQLRDRIRADADFRVNLKNEVAIEKTLERMEEIRRQLPDLRRQVDALGRKLRRREAAETVAPGEDPEELVAPLAGAPDGAHADADIPEASLPRGERHADPPRAAPKSDADLVEALKAFRTSC